MASRQAVDVGRVRADVADAGPGQALQPLRIEALRGQERTLVRRAPERVLAEHPVAANDAMAGHDQGHRVVAECRADGPDGLRPADLRGDPAVRPDLAPGDLEGLHPDVGLEARVATQVQRDVDPPITGQAALDRARQAGRKGVEAMSGSAMLRLHARLECATRGGRLDGAHAQAVEGDPDRADHGLDRGIGLGQTDGDERSIDEPRWCLDPELVEGILDRRVGCLVEAELGWGHRAASWRAVCGGRELVGWRPAAFSASSAARSNAIPRWTWALTVPAGRSRAIPISSYDRPSTWRRTGGAR